MKVYLVSNPSSKSTGISKYADKLFIELLGRVDVELISTHDFMKFVKLVLSPFFNATNALNSFPLYLKLPKKGITHFTNQQLCIPLIYLTRKNIVTVHDIIPYITNTYNSFFESILYKLAMYGLKNADQILADSAHTKKDLINCLKISKDKITVIPLGVDTKEFKPLSVKKEKNTILYVGSEMPRKNFETLLYAFAIVKKQVPGAKLIKVGLPQWKNAREKHIRLAKGLGVSDSIIWKDYVTDLNLEYNKATIFVFPSKYEGFGLPMLEAMAAGTPIICSNATSLPEVGGNAVIYFNANNSEQLAEKIIVLLKSRETQKSVINFGLKIAKDFTWKNTANKTLKIYEKSQAL